MSEMGMKLYVKNKFTFRCFLSTQWYLHLRTLLIAHLQLRVKAHKELWFHLKELKSRVPCWQQYCSDLRRSQSLTPVVFEHTENLFPLLRAWRAWMFGLPAGLTPLFFCSVTCVGSFHTETIGHLSLQLSFKRGHLWSRTGRFFSSPSNPLWK